VYIHAKNIVSPRSIHIAETTQKRTVAIERRLADGHTTNRFRRLYVPHPSQFGEDIIITTKATDGNKNQKFAFIGFRTGSGIATGSMKMGRKHILFCAESESVKDREHFIF